VDICSWRSAIASVWKEWLFNSSSRQKKTILKLPITSGQMHAGKSDEVLKTIGISCVAVPVKTNKHTIALHFLQTLCRGWANFSL
jgi:hypothetical protein